MLAALEQAGGRPVVRLVNLATMIVHNGIEAVGDQKIGADGSMSVGRGDRQRSQPFVGQESLADFDRIARTGSVEQNVGELELSLEPLRVGPGDFSGGLELFRPPRRTAGLASPGLPSVPAFETDDRGPRLPNEIPSIVSLDRAFCEACRYMSSASSIAADRLGRPC